MNYKIVINTLPFKLSRFQDFFREFGLINRNMGYFWPNKYLIGESNQPNHNWILYSSNLKTGITEDFIDKSIMMNECGVSTIIYLDWADIGMSQNVFEDKLLKVISFINRKDQSFQLQFISADIEPDLLKIINKNKYYNFSISKLNTERFKPLIMDTLDKKGLIKSLEGLVDNPLISKLSEILTLETKSLSSIQNSQVHVILDKIIDISNFINTETDTFSIIKALSEKGFFEKYISFKEHYGSKYQSSEDLDSLFIAYWNLLNP